MIPEYYSYSGIVNGSVIHENGPIDSKVMGDVEIEIIDRDGRFLANKIKS